MYHLDGRVRYSEVDECQNVTMSAIVNYFQDCATFHSHDIGENIDFLYQKKKSWILSAWNIEVKRYPRMAEKIRIETWPYEVEKFYGYRNFTIRSEEGELLVGADSIWIWMDLEKNRPARVEKDILIAYGTEKPLVMEKASRKIPVEGNGIKMEAIAVRKHYIDTNHHMNNGQYIRLAQDYLPEDFVIKSMKTEFKKSAVFGDVLYPVVYYGENDITVSLDDENGNSFVVVKFLPFRESDIIIQ